MPNVIGPDVSFYQDDDETVRQIDFLKMSQNAGYVIIRAGQNVWVDSDFAFNWLQAKVNHIPRGSYWFYDSRIAPISQAELWIEQFGGDFGELPLFADFEETYGGSFGGWKNFQIFLERVKKLAITKVVAIYTGYYYWKDHVVDVGGDLAYFHQFPLWIANYGATAPLVPAPWTDGEWLFWQYTENGDGALYGAESKGIDLNYFNGDITKFRARFGLDAPSARPLDVESHTTPFDGVELHRVFRSGSWCSVAVIDPKGKRFLVTPFKMRTTSQAAKDLGAQITINGGAHNAGRAIGLHVSKGYYLSPQEGWEPFCNFTSTNVPEMKYYNAPSKFNALAGKRMIVENGQVSNNQSAAWFEVHPRTLIGIDALGRSILCTIDGRQEPFSGGVDLIAGAHIMMEFGAVLATDLDGGGSTTFVLQLPNGEQKVMNYPIDTGIVGKERIVGDHIAVFVEGIEPPPIEGENMITMTPISNDTRIRVDHNVYASVLQSVFAKVVVSGETLWTAPADGNEVKKGDMWLLVTKVNNIAIAKPGWMARIHKGVTICDNFVDNTVTPPPPDPSTETFTATIKDDATGETWSGILTKQ